MGTTTTPGPVTPDAISFAVAGVELAVAGRKAAHGEVRQAVRLGGTRAAASPVQVQARPGEDVVRLTIANGPTLVLHPEHARDLLSAQASGRTRGAGDAPLVSSQL